MDNTVDSRATSAVVRYALANGFSEKCIIDATGYSAAELSDNNKRIHAIVGPKLLLAIVESGCGVAPPLELGASAPFNFLGGLENLLLLSGSPKRGLQKLTDYFGVFHGGMKVEFSETPKYLSFAYKYTDDEFDNGCANEVVLSVLYRLMIGAFGENGRACELQSGFDANGVKSAYRKAFATPVRFNSADNAFRLTFKRADIEAGGRLFDQELMELVESRLRDRLKLLQQSTQSVEFRDLLNAVEVCVRFGMFRTEDVARHAEISVRSAQRLASENKTSIGQMINDARLALLNERLATDPNCPAIVLAELLGYSDERALRRGLVAWTGMSLSNYRKRKPTSEETTFRTLS
ncbi:MAG: helix-turn-helix domain-containing protein [Pseudomonadota bacterium]